ncbi:hypothetical protein POM88_031580 [Heracleum sosnowskyi]|uniref:Uncharacterized protein n=1 Tax=Heracleum sosnowskyi TaxID=360622 RepID=A0AAD8HZP2_9APIA|nr:hypothetical protein POM88_031580 [Heracleum sosnowskyi]
MFCFEVNSVILLFRAKDCSSEPNRNFLTDERIHFVSFGILEKSHLLPFFELGLTKSRNDVGYIAVQLRNIPKYAKCDLVEVVRKIVGGQRNEGHNRGFVLKNMRIECAICQLFLSSLITMSFLSQIARNIIGGSPEENVISEKIEFNVFVA